jgi:hypothetical protein
MHTWDVRFMRRCCSSAPGVEQTSLATPFQAPLTAALWLQESDQQKHSEHREPQRQFAGCRQQ